MRIVGIKPPDGEVSVAALSADGTVVTVIAELREFWTDPVAWSGRPPTGPALNADTMEIVAPVLPEAKVFCVGLNYPEHVAEGSYAAEPPARYPTVFGRWPSTLTVSGVPIPVPASETGLDWEGEVVAWVGAGLADADPAECHDAVLGYSVFNDITARNAQKRTSQWTLGKNSENSGPLGPLVPAAEVGDLRAGLRLRTRVNGECVQDASTSDMVHSVSDTLSLISRTIGLRPGDLLATGTPAGVGYSRTPARLLHPGDEVEVEVERLGAVRNPIIRRGALPSLTVGPG